MSSLKFGRLPGQVPVGLRDLTYYAAGPLPKPPASVAVPAVAAWGMLGNDTYGDCGVAGLEHGFETAAADTAQPETFPSDQQCVEYYLTYTGGQDSGVVLSQFLAYVRQDGYYGHSVQAYAPVAVHDIPTLQFAVDAYDFAYTGINVTQAMMNAVQGNPPWPAWTLQDTQGDVIGGHCVPIVAYDDQFLTVVTWGQAQQITYPAWHAMSDEAWAVLVGEDVTAKADGHGISLPALEADLNKLAR